MYDISDLELKLKELRIELNDRSYGDRMFSRRLVDCDRALLECLVVVNRAREYRALAARYRPTKYGFKRNLISAVDERLRFLAALCLKQEHLGEPKDPGGQSQRRRVDNHMKHDWLGVIASGVEGLPGGKFLLGPLLKLRNDERAAVRNAEIDQLFEQNRALTEETLGAVLRLEGQHDNDTRALLSLASLVANNIFADEEGLPRAEELRPSRFPLPFSKGLLMVELESLGFDLDEFKFQSRKADFPLPPRVETVETVISGFVDSMTGSDPEKLKSVFVNLHTRRPGSNILRFASYFVGFRVNMADTTHGAGRS